MFVERIEVTAALAADTMFAIGQVDFLIKRLLYRRRVPAPLPANTPAGAFDAADVALVEYGRRGEYATMEASVDCS